MPQLHDPYLNTVKRSLNEEKIKIRKKQIEDIHQQEKDFLSKNIIFSDYIYLPKHLQNFFIFITFITVPCICGIIVMSIVLNQKTFTEDTTFNFDLFILTWTIGYETIAFTLLLLILKSALYFKKTSNYKLVQKTLQ